MDASSQQKPRQQQAQNTIRPSQLKKQQIRQIQQALNKHGFDAGHVDGKWGSDTAKAVKNFQRKENMQASGKLDRQTLQALGVNVTAQGQKKGASTTGQGSNEMQPRLQQHGKRTPQQSIQPSGQNQQYK